MKCTVVGSVYKTQDASAATTLHSHSHDRNFTQLHHFASTRLRRSCWLARLTSTAAPCTRAGAYPRHTTNQSLSNRRARRGARRADKYSPIRVTSFSHTY